MSIRDEITHLVGEVDEMTLSGIVATEASPTEIEQAARWAAGEAMARPERHELGGRAEAVYDLPAGEPVQVDGDLDGQLPVVIDIDDRALRLAVPGEVAGRGARALPAVETAP